MPDIEIYSTTVCPYCVRAKMLLDKKKVTYREFNLTKNPELREEMLARSNGMKTVPQIFINGVHVGGCDDLYELDLDGKLDPMLVRL
ncbi:MAG TPA: glutaredoxin 3 [Alphaproteobacteria bacterium]|nr:glutaredoxin 3 [Alphaproteobacteria bacterium]